MQAAVTRPRPRRAPISARNARLLLRISAVAVTAMAAWSFLLAPLLGHFTGHFEDFSVYVAAARDMAAGRSPYTSFNGNVSVVMAGFDYPPFAAVLVRPLALLSDSGALALWLWLSFACTVAGAVVVARTALPASWPRTDIALLAALAFAPATYNYWHGQMNPVIFLLLALAFRAWVQDRELSCGVLLGLAAGIKLSPIVLVVLLLRRRWWRGAAAMALTAVASVAVAVPLIGAAGVRSFFDAVLPALSRDTGWIYNQSLGGLISRATDHSVLRIGATSSPLHLAVLAAGVAVLALAAWRVRAGRRDGAERGVEFGLGVVAMLLCASIAWYPHFTHLLIPIAAAAGLAARRGWRPERRLVRALAACLVVFGLLVPLALDNLDMRTLSSIAGTPAWWPFLQLFSLPALAAVALFAAMHAALGRERRPTVPARA